jgi:hypothetical protein
MHFARRGPPYGPLHLIESPGTEEPSFLVTCLVLASKMPDNVTGNVREAGHWADRTLADTAEAAVKGNTTAEKAIKIVKQARRLGWKT